MPERYKIIVDIERGKSQLTYTVTLKTAHWSEMPWALFAVCHRDPEVAVDAFSTALASESRHPQVSVLWDPALQTQVLSFCEEPRALLTSCDSVRGELTMAQAAKCERVSSQVRP